MPEGNVIGGAAEPAAFISIGPFTIGRLVPVATGLTRGEVRVDFPAYWSQDKCAAFLHQVGELSRLAMVPAAPMPPAAAVVAEGGGARGT